jgi:pimeloyl-ACP methyl ester carboxylesterase
MNATLISILAIVAVLFVIRKAIHIGFRAPRLIEQGSPADFDISYRDIDIPTRRGKRLFAWWLPAPNSEATSTITSAPTIILMHGWGSNAELMLPLAVPLHHAGMNVLLLDARNHGRSDADNFSSMPRFAEDVSEAMDWVRHQSNLQNDQLVLLGHSVGAAAVLLEASRRHDIAAVISLATFAHPEWMMRRYLGRAPLPKLFVKGVLRYVERVIGHRYEAIAPMHTTCLVRCPVLLVHGTADKTVPMSDALAIRDQCNRDQSNKESIELLLIEGADHESVDKIEEHADQLIEFLARAGVIKTAR